MIECEELSEDLFQLQALFSNERYTPESIEGITKLYSWLPAQSQKTTFEMLFSLFLNPVNEPEIRVAAGNSLCTISFSSYFKENPIIKDSCIQQILDAFTNIDTELAQYGVNIISQQILYSDELYIGFYSCNLLSEYFINLCDAIDLSLFILALSKWPPPQQEAKKMLDWASDIVQSEEGIIGDQVIAVKVLANLKCHESNQNQPEPLVVQVDQEILNFIYEHIQDENEEMRESCLFYLFCSNDDLEPILETLLEIVSNNVSENGFKLILKFEEELCENLPSEMSELLFAVASNYPYIYQKAALGAMFKHHLQTNIDALDIFPLLLHFLNDEELVEDFAPALINYIVMSPSSEALEMIDILDQYQDLIHTLTLSENEKIAECGLFLERISAPIQSD